MIKSVIYKYIDKNYSLKYVTSVEILYLYDKKGEGRVSRHAMFNDLKVIFGVENEDFIFDVYSEWVNNKKESILVTC
jgi:hypothetical protein